jgi:hypothetical protein
MKLSNSPCLHLAWALFHPSSGARVEVVVLDMSQILCAIVIVIARTLFFVTCSNVCEVSGPYKIKTVKGG